MPARSFFVPPRIHVGEGALGEAPKAAADLGLRALVVSGPSTERMGRTGQLADLLRSAGLAVEVYAGVDHEPTTDHVLEGVRAAHLFGADMVVGIGGGSALDAAKAIAAMVTNPGTISDYQGPDRLQRPALPLVAIPTTSGTGSEVTRFTVITKEDGQDPVQVGDHVLRPAVKMLIGSPHLIPAAAIVDPELTCSAPPHVTAASGIDALTHAIEAFISRRRQPLTDALALTAISRLSRFLVRATMNPEDPEARRETMLGSLEAGMAFSNASVALVHGLARPMGAYFHVPHGLANGMLLPTVMRYSWPAEPDRYARVASALGVGGGTDPEEAAQAAVHAVEGICRALDLPMPARYGMTGEALTVVAETMAKDALASGSPQNNPRTPDVSEMVGLYREMCEAAIKAN